MPYEPPPPSVEDARSQIVDLQNPDEILGCSEDSNCLPHLQQFFGLQGTAGVECALAIVPDPYHTRLALFTDHTIEAIEKGAVAAGWEFAAEWLPWNDTADPNQGDPAVRAQQRTYIRTQEMQPGVLAFRHAGRVANKSTYAADWGQGALLVFVVGETPTAGVNPGQFQIARAYMNALRDPNNNPDQVRIDGPAFSGSFDSLAFLIRQDQARQPGKKYQIQSGTAQSLDAAQAFTSQAGADVAFHSATENLSDQSRHFQDVLKDLRIPADRAAVLAEDESTFGGEASYAGSHRPGPGQDLPSPVRVFRFPRDVSHLRDAYRQAQQTAQPGNAPVPNLDFSIKDPTVGEDSVPTYSQAQTPLSQNGVINEITRTLLRDNIRIVEVSATNVLDLLFLAGVLRRQCPDTRLLIQSADLLFVQAEQTQPLNGTLFLASYPLFAESKLWQGDTAVPIFPDTLSQGVFNATVLLLGKTAVADYAWHSVPYPAAWLLTMDRRGFSPVRVWANSAAKDWFQPVTGNPEPDLGALAPPRMWNLLLSAFALFSVAIGAWILRLCRQKDWDVDARLEPPESEDSWRGFHLLLFLLILAGIQIAIRAARPFDTDRLWLIVTLLGCGLPVSLAAFTGFRQRHAGWKCWLAMGLGAVAVLAAVVEWLSCLREGSQNQLLTQGQLFSFRAAELRFGSSPLWPIVAAAAALLLWCFVQVTRLYFAACQQPEVITDGVETVLKGRLRQSYDRFNESARSPLGLSNRGEWRWFAIGLAAFAGLCCLLRVDERLSSIDGTPYDILCIALELLVTGLLLLACWHIRLLWRSLHRFTTSLDMLPLARAFIQASPAGGNRPILVRHFNLQSLEIHSNSMLVLHDIGLQLKQLANPLLSVDQVSHWEKQYRERVDNALTIDSPRDRQALVDGHRELWSFNKLVASQMCERILRNAWESEPSAGKLGGEPSSKPEQQVPEDQDTAVPTRKQPLNTPGDPQKLVDLAQTFVALHYSQFLLYGVRQIQNLLWFPSIGSVLLMFSMSSYNFQAPQSIGRFLLVLFVAITLILGTCMVQIQRDPVLSRIAGTNWNATFYLKLARYGALPIIGLLASLFPSISNFLFSWMEPALEALK